MTTRILLTVVWIVLCAGSAAYAEWLRVGTNVDETNVVYVDPNTIRHKGGTVKWWELWDFKTAQTIGGSTHLSSKIQMEYDCVEERKRILALVDFSGNMGDGHVVGDISTENKWVPVVPESLSQVMWNAACNKK